jgi:hypothetical protein
MSSLSGSNNNNSRVRYLQIVNRYLVKIENNVQLVGDKNGYFQKLTFMLKDAIGIPTNNGKEIIVPTNLKNISNSSNIVAFKKLYNELMNDIDKEYSRSQNFILGVLGNYLQEAFRHLNSKKGGDASNNLTSFIEKSENHYDNKKYGEFLKVSSNILNVVEREYSNMQNNTISKNMKSKFIVNIKKTKDIINYIMEVSSSNLNQIVKNGGINILHDLIRSTYTPLYTLKNNNNNNNNNNKKKQEIREALNNSNNYIKQIMGNEKSNN